MPHKSYICDFCETVLDKPEHKVFIEKQFDRIYDQKGRLISAEQIFIIRKNDKGQVINKKPALATYCGDCWNASSNKKN